MLRDESISIQFNEGTGNIIGTFSCSDFMEIYKMDVTFQIQSPETLDPKKRNSNMQWSYRLKEKIGTSNKIIARLIIELDEFTKQAYISDAPETLLLHDQFYTCKELLLQCEKVALTVNNQTDKINKQLSKEIIKNKRVIHTPCLENIENLSKTFLQKAKEYIQSLAEIFNILFEQKFHGPRFDKIKNFIRKKFSEEDELYQFISKNEQSFLRPIIDWRNLIEHPKKDNFFQIHNYELTPNNKIIPPRWKVSEEISYPIAEQMNFIVKSLLSFGEIFYIMCIQRRMQFYPLKLCAEIISEKNQDIQCPILYKPQIQK